jgi:hypothetical protein
LYRLRLAPGRAAASILAEAWATAFEGWLYRRIAGVPIRTGLLWSALANQVTLLVGCCLVALTL